MQLTEKHLEYWSKNLRVTAILLFIWFVATFVLGYYARDLSFNFFGWPFAFYMAAQGSLIIYVVIIWYYARYMNNLDRAGFNDKARSLRVESGYWIFCSDANFQGNCHTYGPGDYPNLPSGQSHSISSGRQVSNNYPYRSNPNWGY